MKTVGYILFAFGVALLIFIVFSFFKEKNKVHSPLPEEEGIKVIQISPSN